MVRLLATLLVLLVCAAATADDRLEWKLTDGQSLFVREVIKQSTRIDVGGRAAKSESTQTCVTGYRVLAIGPGGEARLEMKWLSIESGDGNAESTARFRRLVQGTTFLVTIDGRGNVTQFDGYDSLVKRVTRTDTQLEDAFRAVLNEEWIRSTVTQTFGVVPGQDVAAGDAWRLIQIVPLGPLGDVTLNYEVKHTGPVSEDQPTRVGLELSGQGKYVAPPPDTSPLGFEISSADLKFDSLQGEGEFDVESGRLVRLESGLHVSGPVSLKFRDKTSKATVESTVQRTVTVHDRDPLEEKTSD